MKTLQARTSAIQRLAKALELAGIKLGSVASDIARKSAMGMIEALAPFIEHARKSGRRPGRRAARNVACGRAVATSGRGRKVTAWSAVN